LLYIGQTERTLNIRYKEHIGSVKYNREESGYATHILNNAHCYGKTGDVMEKIDYAKTGRTMTIEENFYIYLYKRHNKLTDEQRAHDENHANILYETAIAHIDTPI
jgi:hypothetical protein